MTDIHEAAGDEVLWLAALGTVVARRRAVLRWTQTDLATACRVAQATVSRIEAGEADVDTVLLCRIAASLSPSPTADPVGDLLGEARRIQTRAREVAAATGVDLTRTSDDVRAALVLLARVTL